MAHGARGRAKSGATGTNHDAVVAVVEDLVATVVRHALQVDPLSGKFTWPLQIEDGRGGWRLVWSERELPDGPRTRSRISWTGALVPREIREAVGPVNGVRRITEPTQARPPEQNHTHPITYAHTKRQHEHTDRHAKSRTTAISKDTGPPAELLRFLKRKCLHNRHQGNIEKCMAKTTQTTKGTSPWLSGWFQSTKRAW